MVEQFTDDYTLNVTKEGYTFLTVRQAVEFLRGIEQDKVGQEEGYLLQMIEKKRLEVAQKIISQSKNNTLIMNTEGDLNSVGDRSFNMLSNPITDKNNQSF